MEIRVRGGFDNPLLPTFVGSSSRELHSVLLHCVSTLHADLSCKNEASCYGFQMQSQAKHLRQKKGKKKKRRGNIFVPCCETTPCLGNHVTGSVRPKLKSMEKDLRSRQSIKNVSLLHLYTLKHARSDKLIHTHTHNRKQGGLCSPSAPIMLSGRRCRSRSRRCCCACCT